MDRWKACLPHETEQASGTTFHTQTHAGFRERRAGGRRRRRDTQRPTNRQTGRRRYEGSLCASLYVHTLTHANKNPPQEVRRGGGVVHDERYAVLMRHLGHHLDVHHYSTRVRLMTVHAFTHTCDPSRTHDARQIPGPRMMPACLPAWTIAFICVKPCYSRIAWSWRRRASERASELTPLLFAVTAKQRRRQSRRRKSM